MAGSSTPSTRPWRRCAVAAALVAVLAPVLAGCGANSSSSSGSSSQSQDTGPITLQFWTYSLKSTDPQAEAIIQQYEKEHPNVTIKLSEVGGTAETSSKLLAADKADNAPDVAQLEYRALPGLILSGALRDITSDVASSRSNVAENIWSLASLNGKTYGVPQDIGPMTMTYRSDLFKKYGITSAPTTWAEYAKDAEIIHTKNPQAYIAAFAPSEFQFFSSMAAQAGANWWKTDGNSWNVGFDSTESLATADYWEDLVKRDLVKVEPLVTPEWNAQVNAGKILSWSAAAWVPSVIYSVAPDTAGKWESAPLPQWTAGNAAVPFQGGSAYVVPAKSKHAAAAAEFAAWLGGSAEGSKLLLTNLNIYPGGNGGREATLSADPPKLMPQQKDFYAIADQVIKNTTIDVTWAPDSSVAETYFDDALNKAANDKSSFRAVYEATQQVAEDDLKKSGYTVSQ